MQLTCCEADYVPQKDQRGEFIYSKYCKWGVAPSVAPHTLSIMLVYCFNGSQSEKEREATTDGCCAGRGGVDQILATAQVQGPTWSAELFKHCLGCSRENKQKKVPAKTWSGVERVRGFTGWCKRVGGGFHCGWRDSLLPICQWTACPPMSYLKNLVSQCNMAPSQSLQLAVWALFRVVSWQLAPHHLPAPHWDGPITRSSLSAHSCSRCNRRHVRINIGLSY